MDAYITGNHELFVRSFDDWLEVGVIKRKRNRNGDWDYVLLYDGYDDTHTVFVGNEYPTASHAERAFREYQRGG